MKPTLLVLAAGMGSRYGGLKQMDAFGPNGETIIEYSVYDAINAGFGKVVFIVRAYFLDAFKQRFDEKFGDKISLVYITQELDKVPEGSVYNEERSKPWGTAHAVWVGAESINEPFGVINADDFYGADAFKQLANFLINDQTKNYCVVAYYLNNTLSEHGTVNRGVCKSDEEGNLIDVVERIKIGKSTTGRISFPSQDGGDVELEANTLVSMNMWGFKTSYFDYTEQQFADFLIEFGHELTSEFYIPSVVDKLIKDNTLAVKILKTSSSWFGVTYPEDKEAVSDALNKLIAEGQYPNKLD